METAKPEAKKKEVPNFLVLLTLVACLPSCQIGFSLWLINDPVTVKRYLHILTTQVVEKTSLDIQIHPALLVFTVVAFQVGSLFGSLLFGPLADKCGRKGVLLINDIFGIVSTIILVISKSIHAHGLSASARFFSGVCTGMISCAIPMYLGEISPTNLRGGLNCVSMMSISVGMLMSQVLGGPALLGTKEGLPFLLSIPGVLALLQFLLLLPFPESPRYLLIQKRDEEGARQALKKLREQDDVEDEIEELRQEDLYEKKEKQMTIFKLLRSPRLRWQLSCVFALFATQQFSGIIAAYYYSERVFLTFKLDEELFRYFSAVLTFLILFVHGLSIYVIDSWGRRPLLLIGIGTCIITCVLLTMSLELQVIMPWMAYVSCFLLFVFISGIAVGPNSIPHLMITELFLQSSRSSAYAVLGFFQWCLILIIGFSFSLAEEHIGSYSFLIFLPFSVAGFFYILKVVPETKKKTFLEIRKLLEIYLAKNYLTEKPAAKKKPEVY